MKKKNGLKSTGLDPNYYFPGVSGVRSRPQRRHNRPNGVVAVSPNTRRQNLSVATRDDLARVVGVTNRIDQINVRLFVPMWA